MCLGSFFNISAPVRAIRWRHCCTMSRRTALSIFIHASVKQSMQCELWVQAAVRQSPLFSLHCQTDACRKCKFSSCYFTLHTWPHFMQSTSEKQDKNCWLSLKHTNKDTVGVTNMYTYVCVFSTVMTCRKDCENTFHTASDLLLFFWVSVERLVAEHFGGP